MYIRLDETRGDKSLSYHHLAHTLIDMLFTDAKEPTEENGTGKCREEKS